MNKRSIEAPSTKEKKYIKRSIEAPSTKEEIYMANVGDYIKFGNYPQTANGDIQPIEWQVLAKEENKMLLISKYALESKCFDNDWVKNWKKSEIRQWLNGEFYNKAFNENEKKLIRYSSISTEVEI